MPQPQNRQSWNRLPSRRALLAGAGAMAAGLALHGCQRAAAPVDEAGRIRLRLALDRAPHADQGGFYQAVASGAYERRGLNVQILAAAPGADVAQRLASGAAELALAASSLAPLALAAEGAPVRAVAAFFQKDPRIVMTRPTPETDALADLGDRPVVMDEADRQGLWLWLKARYGFTDAQALTAAADAPPFASDPGAARLGDLARDVARIEAEAGFAPRLLLPADDGYASYGALVLTPNAFARDNAAALRAFIAASVEGWRDYLHGDASGADALIRADAPGLPQAALDRARALLRAHGVVDGGDAALYGLGAMTAERWQAFHEAMAPTGLWPSPPDWRNAFTDAYLPGRS